MTMFTVLSLSLLASLTVAQNRGINQLCHTDQEHFVYRVPKHSCSCNAKSDGTLRYHDKKLQICNGQKYVDVGGSPAPAAPVGTKGNPATSCNQIATSRSGARSGSFYIKTGSRVTKEYCYMGHICGSRGWTMIMKINGHSNVFGYDSHYWSNKEVYNPSGAGSGLGHQETKLASYWTYTLHKLCLGMSTGGVTHWLPVNYHKTTLYDAIAPGVFKGFAAGGRTAWKNLIPNSSLQRNCNREGFNVFGDLRFSKARIGIIGNQENNCNSADSRIGFGTGGGRCGENSKNSAGNEARCSSDNGNRSLFSFGYIFAQ